MANNKTQETDADVGAFLASVPDPARRADAQALCETMARITSEPARLWGPSIVGFGRYHYKYESGREGESMLVGFSPRAKELVLYLGLGAGGRDDLLARLGRHRTGKGCLYLKSLADADSGVLETLIAVSYASARERHAAG
ncbi:MAG: hypothetical protein JWO81_400 [Alphaproteobacteria bacterium]|nr:hypothetical protein [Alphaproteobacteria bacterium]